MFAKFYIVWTILVVAIILLKDGLNNENITRLIIIAILGLALFVFKRLKPKNPKRFFIFSGVVIACLVEGAYMITKPVLPSLLVTNANIGSFFHHYLIDLLLTAPVYILIFWVIWKLIHKFSYTKWEYIFLMALGQSFGDGSSFFIVAPGALIFLPYVMLNYHAMNVPPYLAIRNSLSNTGSNSKWKYPVTVLVLYITYFIGGATIKFVAKLANF